MPEKYFQKSEEKVNPLSIDISEEENSAEQQAKTRCLEDKN